MALTLALSTLALPAQTAPPSPVTASAPGTLAPATPAPASAPPRADATPDDPTIELSPFEVRAEDDVGYQAANTTSGSRLNSRLKDTPASISPFTAEFLSDIAATNLEDMLGYALNIEPDFEDATAGFNESNGRDTGGSEYNFRMRGMLAGVSQDFTDSALPVDLYNVERAEVASGPNSILFGLGAPGGLVSLSGKKATLNRDRTTLKGSWGSWHFERYEADYNKVLIPRKLSFRLLGVYQNNEGWRHWDYNDQKRLTGAVAYQPFKGTTVHASYERGKTANSLSLSQNAGDQLSLWHASGRPVTDALNVAGTNQIPVSPTNPTPRTRFTFSEQDGTTYNLQGELQSSNRFSNPGAPTSNPTLVTPDVMPYNFNLTGPGGARTQDFSSQRVVIQQRVGKDLNFELGYFRNESKAFARGMDTRQAGIELRGDPNLRLPATAGGAPNAVLNPRGGQLFLESEWFQDRLQTTNEIARLSASWEVDLGRWFGRHRIAGLLETSEQDRLKRWKNEILVDQNNVPVSNAVSPEDITNRLTRRHYVTEGDFVTYYGGDGRIEMPAFAYNGRQLTSTYAARTRSNTKTLKEVDGAMLASQSFWLKDRLVTTLGYRQDKISFQNAEEVRITDPNDPRVRSRQIVLNEWEFSGATATRRYKANTFSTGAVLHATKRLSLFYNTSKNSGAPRFDRTVLPDGQVPPPTDGVGRDYGVMIDPFADERFFLRITRYNTDQINDAAVVPDGVSVPTSNTLGGDNLTAILTALRNASRITPADFDRQNIAYNAATIDLLSEGTEIELGANPTKNLTLRLNYSQSKRQRGNFFEEVYDFYGSKLEEWRSLAAGNPALLATIDSQYALINAELENLQEQQSPPFASRPHKLNGTARYKFSEGALRGFTIGGSVRYQGKNFVSRDRSTTPPTDYFGNEKALGDVFGTYRTKKMPWLNIPMTIQLNVKNVTNSYLVSVGRYNGSRDGVRRVYLVEPRSYRLTTTFEF